MLPRDRGFSLRDVSLYKLFHAKAKLECCIYGYCGSLHRDVPVDRVVARAVSDMSADVSLTKTFDNVVAFESFDDGHFARVHHSFPSAERKEHQ